MRLTKLEKHIDQLVADGTPVKEIAGLVGIPDDALTPLMSGITAKYQAERLKTARKRDNVMRNEILAPKLFGMKCKNLEQPNPKYWLFEGDTRWALKAQEQLNSLGIYAPVKPNGTNGHSILVVDKWVTGELWEGVRSTQQTTAEQGKENEHVNNSVANTATTTREIFDQSTQGAYREERRLLKSVA